MTGYRYFTLRLRSTVAGEPPECSGEVERLGAGDRQSFGNAEELLRLLGVGIPDAATASPHQQKMS